MQTVLSCTDNIQPSWYLQLDIYRGPEVNLCTCISIQSQTQLSSQQSLYTSLLSTSVTTQISAIFVNSAD